MFYFGNTLPCIICPEVDKYIIKKYFRISLSKLPDWFFNDSTAQNNIITVQNNRLPGRD